jgi:hypothetical protein
MLFADNVKSKGIIENLGIIDELMRRTFHRNALSR